MTAEVRRPTTIAARFVAARKKAGLSGNRIAEAAQSLSLYWYRSTLARIERGERRLEAEELLLLPAIFAAAGASLDLRELLDADLRLTDKVVASRDVVAGLLTHGETPYLWPESPKLPVARERVHDAMQAGSRPYSDAEVKWTLEEVAKAASSHPLPPDDRRDSHAEAEVRMARDLGVGVMDVVIAARRRWGVSVTILRDHTADLLVERKWLDTPGGPGQSRAAETAVARRRATTVLKQELKAAMSRKPGQPKGRD